MSEGSNLIPSSKFVLSLGYIKQDIYCTRYNTRKTPSPVRFGKRISGRVFVVDYREFFLTNNKKQQTDDECIYLFII